MTTQTENALAKVPEVTLGFWIIKIAATTLGETGGDAVSMSMQLGYLVTTGIFAAVFLAAVIAQMKAKSFHPLIYWSTVVFVSVFGTLVTDNLSDVWGVPMAVSTGVFSVLLMVVFGIWHAREKTLSIHEVDSLPRELYYWVAILTTFALGTAAGDWFAEGLQLGYANSALVFGGAIALVYAAHKLFRVSAVGCFWIAYILTRPLGASLGDWLSQTPANGGLGLGATGTSGLFLVTIVGAVAYLSLFQKKLA